jgi:hypothetical protein
LAIVKDNPADKEFILKIDLPPGVALAGCMKTVRARDLAVVGASGIFCWIGTERPN